VTLAAGQPVVIYLHFLHDYGDLDLYLLDTDGHSFLTGSTGITNNESISYTVAGAGAYYVMVDGFLLAQNVYDLSVSGGCYAHAVSDFASVDSQAVRDAVAEAAPGSTVKVAGYCPGTANEGGALQTVRISKTLTLAGGYAPGAWSTAHPLTQPTTLDAMNGGRVISATGPLTLTGLTIQHGNISGVGGGLYVEGDLVVSGTTFYSNTASFAGGGVFMLTGETVLTSTKFIENVAGTGRGGGITALNATLNGGRFEGNQTGTNGGGLSVANDVELAGTEFVDNHATGLGGGLFVSAPTRSSVNTAHFEGNHAANGGGIYVELDRLTISGTTFVSNTANSGGGLLAVQGVVVQDSTFVANTAVNGGGMSIGGPLTMLGGTLQRNSAVVGGGAAAYDSMQITGTKFVSNVASFQGGGLTQLDSEQAERGLRPAAALPGRLVNVLFAGNTAAEGLDLNLAATTNNSLLHGTFVAGGHPVTEAVAVNNGSLTMHNDLLSGYSTAVERTSGNLNEDYNLYFGGGATVGSYLSGTVTSGGNSRVADPLLANAATGDYHLTVASPAVDRGVSVGVAVDYEGDARPYAYRVDIGFDELVGYPIKLNLPVILR
jgi:predicted outer membrane repeat protein